MNPSIALRMAAVAAGFCGIVGAARADLIVNGSFEQPVVADGRYQLVASGSSFAGWRVIGAPGNVAPISGNYRNGAIRFPAQDGAQWLDLTGLSNTATGVEQTVATQPGTAYDLAFYVGNVVAPPGWGRSSSVQVLIDGRPLGVATNSDGAGLNAQVWQRFAMTFTAKGSETTIAFLNLDPASDNTNGLDNVTLTVHGQSPTACNPPPAKKKFNPLAALAAIADGVAGVRKVAATSDSAASQQALNSVNRVAETAAAGALGPGATPDCGAVAGLAGEGGAAPQATVAEPPGGPGAASPPDAAPAAAEPRSRPARSRSASADQPQLVLTSSPASVASPAAGSGPARPLPDIVGLRAGLSPSETLELLQKRYPKTKFATDGYDLSPYRPAAEKFLESVYFGYQQLAAQEERLIVHFTPPPGKPAAWRLRREMSRQQIYQANVVESLRAKYGKESIAFYGGELTSDDAHISQMWWVLDAQGRPAPLPNVAGSPVNALSSCAGLLTDSREEPGHNPFNVSDVTGRTTSFEAASPWCNAAALLVWADFPSDGIVRRMTVEIVDVANALRAGRAEAEWLNGIAKQLQQQQINAAKKAAPSL